MQPIPNSLTQAIPVGPGSFQSSFFGLLFFILTSVQSYSAPSVFDLAGKWEGNLEMGKFKLRLILRMVKTDENRLQATADLPDQGTKGIPIGAVLFNHPDIRIEFDAFGSAFRGTLNDAATELVGAFEEGPGGRPAPTKFIKSTTPDKPELKRIYTWSEKSPPDARGYWKGQIEMFPGMKARVGLKVARVEDGSYAMDLDNLDFGMADIPATEVKLSQKKLAGEWQMFQAKLEAEMAEDGRTLQGSWTQAGRNIKVTFERTEKAETALPSDLVFTPSKTSQTDPVGYWLGTLEVGEQKLRLRFKIGRTPKGELAGSLSSLDQGRQEIPLTKIESREAEQIFELGPLRAKFSGQSSKDGQTLEGTWDQAGNKLPLKLRRISQKDSEEIR